MRLVRLLPALPFTALVYLRYHRRFSLFRHPKSYSELVNHKKLYKHDPLLTLTADKYAVRQYVKEKVGEQYLVPLQQVAGRPEDLDFEAFEGRVVIKGTHGCEMTMIVDSSEPVDRQAVMAETSRWLQSNWYHVWKEWAYRDIEPRLIVEQFIGSGNEPPADYKFHTFNGRVEMIQVDTGRFTEHRSTLLTRDWKPLDVGVTFGALTSLPEPPSALGEMMKIAETLAADFEHARIDLYNVDGRIYFGEITHYPGAASVSFDPPSFDDALGELWRNRTPIPAHFVRDSADG